MNFSPRSFAVGLLAALAVTVTAGHAEAAPAYCVPGPASDNLALGDVTFRGAAADDCYGVVLEEGDITVGTVNSIWSSLYGGGNFGFRSESNDGPVNVNGMTIDFILDGEESATSGGWNLVITPNGGGAPYPQTFDIVMILENKYSGTDQYALYFFNDETFTDGSDVSGTWKVAFTNASGVVPKLDEGILYFRNGTAGGSGGVSGQTVVPEPASLLLFGSGLALMRRAARRRAK